MELLEETRDNDSFTDLFTALRECPSLTALGTSFSIIAGIYLFSISVMFPFYVYVYRSNRERDEGVSVFPITNHFYYVVVFMQCFLYITLMSTVLSLFSSNSLISLGVFSEFVIAGYFMYGIITLVLNFLLFFLALQRFLIYTYPKCDSYISPKRSTFKRIMIYVYLVVIVLHIALRVHKIKCLYTNNSMVRNYSSSGNNSKYTVYDKCVEQYDDIYMYVYLFSDFLVFISSIFYIIMLIKIRQFTKMASTLRSKPEKFILFQTALIIVMKIVFVPLAMIIKVTDFGLSLDAVFYTCLAIDIATAQFVIQVSYLACNKNNLDTLLSIRLKKTKTWLVLCCGAHPSIASTSSFDLTSIPNQQKK